MNYSNESEFQFEPEHIEMLEKVFIKLNDPNELALFYKMVYGEPDIESAVAELAAMINGTVKK